MRVLFNTTAALEGTSGFTQTIELLSALKGLHTHHEYAVLTTRPQATLRDALGPQIEHIVIDVPRGGWARTVSLWAKLPGLVRRAKADVLYNRGNFYAPHVPCRQICLIENANPFSILPLLEPLTGRARNRLLRVMSDAALRHATAVVFPSHAACENIVNRRVVRARTFVIHHGAEMPEPGRSDPPLLGPYILVVSSLFPFKNLSIAIRALDLLRTKQAFDGRLVIIGDPGPAVYARTLEREIAMLGLGSLVRIQPAVSRPELSAWFRHAELALTTSLEETFGLPVVEAMALGTPVVAPDRPSSDRLRYFLPFRELCDDAAEYFDPFDAASCAAAIERALAEPRRSTMIAAGLVRVRQFTWRRAALRTVEMLDAIAGKPVTLALDASSSCSDNARNGTTGRVS